MWKSRYYSRGRRLPVCLELKVTDNSKDIDTKLNEAKEQIIKNKYARRLTDKTVVPVALVLENNSKSREKRDTPVCEIVALEKV